MDDADGSIDAHIAAITALVFFAMLATAVAILPAVLGAMVAAILVAAIVVAVVTAALVTAAVVTVAAGLGR